MDPMGFTTHSAAHSPFLRIFFPSACDGSKIFDQSFKERDFRSFCQFFALDATTPHILRKKKKIGHENTACFDVFFLQGVDRQLRTLYIRIQVCPKNHGFALQSYDLHQSYSREGSGI